MKNGNFLSGESCFDGTQDGWVEGHPSGDITPTCQTVTNNQTNVKLGVEQFVVSRDWSEYVRTNGTLKQSKLKKNETQLFQTFETVTVKLVRPLMKCFPT